MKVELADTSDVGELAVIGSQVFWNAYGGTAPDADIEHHVQTYFSEAAIGEEMARSGVTYLKATEDGQLAGLVKMRDGDVPQLLPANSAVEVQQLYVSVDFQRRGVGALLMDAAASQVRERGIDGIWLSVWSEADWATSFYLKYGFVSVSYTHLTLPTKA